MHGVAHPAHHHPVHADVGARKRETLQRKLGSDSAPGEIRPHIDALAGAKRHVFARGGDAQQAAVGRDGDQSRSIGPRELIGARVRSVDESQTVGARRDA